MPEPADAGSEWRELAAKDGEVAFTKLFHSRDEIGPRLSGDVSVLVKLESELLSNRLLHGKIDDVAWMSVVHADLDGLKRLVAESPSAPVRAGAAMALWFAPNNAGRRFGSKASADFLEWHTQARDAALRVADEDEEGDLNLETAGIWMSSTGAFGRACEMATRCNANLDVGKAAADFMTKTRSVGRARWALEIAEELVDLPSRYLDRTSIELICEGLRAEAQRYRTSNMGLERRCIACEARLRARVGRPVLDADKEIAQSFEAEAALFAAVAPIAAHHLRDALEAWRRVPNADADRDRVLRALDAANRAVPESLTPLEVSVSIPEAEMAEFLEQFEEIPLVDAVSRVANGQFIVSRAECEAGVASNAAESPLFAMMGREVVRPDATSHRASPENDDVLVVENATQRLAASGVFLQAAFECLRSRGLRSDHFVGVCTAPGSLARGEEAFLKSAFEAWGRRDWIACVCVLVPRLERLLRRLVEATGGTTLRSQTDGEQRMLLGATLDHLERICPENSNCRNAIFTLRVVLDSRAGGALRHEIAHGLVERVDESTANLVVLLYLHAVLMRPRAPPPTQRR